MSNGYLRLFFCLGLLSMMHSALAESFLTSTWIVEPTQTVRSSGVVTVTAVDEVDRMDVELSLYLDDLIDIELDYSPKTCLYVSPSTSCSVSASYSPYTLGCKYCGDFSYDLLSNNESNPANPPNWQVVDSGGGEVCATAPTGGGGGGPR